MPRKRRTRRGFLATTALVVAGCADAPDGPETSRTAPTTAETITTTTWTGTTRPTGPDGYDLAVEHDVESWPAYDPDWEAPTGSPRDGSVEAEVLVEGLEVPWDLAFAPNGELFVSERTGRILRLESGDATPVAEPERVIDAGAVEPGEEEVVWWVEGGEGGLLGVAVHPNYPEPPVVYAYYTYEAEGERYNRVSYFDASADDPAATETTILDGIPGETIHNGGRLAFGPANYLWITAGDAGAGAVARDPSALGGKLLRVKPDGEPAPDNPDLGGDPRVYTYGHRNPQGITWLPDATPVSTEHGPTARDEVNVLDAGGNYGWPDVRDPEEYRADPDGVAHPVVNTGPGRRWAPSGAVFYTGDAVPAWRNRLLVGGLFSQRLLVVTLSRPDGGVPPLDGESRRYDADWLDDRYTATVHHFLVDELGRIRHVEQGPDGGVYAITSNRDGRSREGFPRQGDDVLVRLTQS